MVDSLNRLDGARAAFGVKKPVRAATTANVTLSGFQTIDGVTFAATDEANGLNTRVLVKDQTDTTKNGIYTVSSSDWARAKDFDGNTDFVENTIVCVQQGTINADRIFRVTSSYPPSVGVNTISFRPYTIDDWTANATVASAATIDLDAVDADYVTISGTTDITAITLGEGKTRILFFAGSLTLTHSVTDLVLPGGGGINFGQDIVTSAGDYAIIRGTSSNTVRCIVYTRKDGRPLTAGEASVASSATTNLSGSLGEVYEQCITITGTVTITSFGSGAPTGDIKFCLFEDALTLTHNAASMILPGGQDITTAAGDSLIAKHEGSGNWRIIKYSRANAHPLTTGDTTLASAATADLGSLTEQSITVTGTTGITAFGSSAPTGAVKFVTFQSSLLLTHNGSSLILPGGQDLQVFAGDSIVAKHEGSGNWRVPVIQRAAPRLTVDGSDAATSTTGEDDLLTSTLNANALASSGHSLRILAWGVTAATTFSKRVRIYLGTDVVSDSTDVVMNDDEWRSESFVTRTSSIGQKATSQFLHANTSVLPTLSLSSTPSQTLSSTLTIKVTGICSASTAAAEITARGLAVELLTP